MVSFHKHLNAGAERDEALRLAMCDVANSKTPGWSAPYHWAAFVMVGETGKMP
jgi:CHAT domain-containing protein